MKVLGISPLDKDSTVTLVEDGKILYAAAEERFTRVKLQDGFPWCALENAFEKTKKINLGDIPYFPIRGKAADNVRQGKFSEAEVNILASCRRIHPREAAFAGPGQAQRAWE